MAEQTLISILPWDEVGRHLDQAIKIGLSLSQRAVVEQATFYKVYGAVRQHFLNGS
jgi:methyl coenzyme M reductase gamma subunit